jgi:hypothetical protein
MHLSMLGPGGGGGGREPHTGGCVESQADMLSWHTLSAGGYSHTTSTWALTARFSDSQDPPFLL